MTTAGRGVLAEGIDSGESSTKVSVQMLVFMKNPPPSLCLPSGTKMHRMRRGSAFVGEARESVSENSQSPWS